MTLTNISVSLLANDNINRHYLQDCGSVGVPPSYRSHEFTCVSNFNDFRKAEFVVSGYDTTNDDEWSTKVSVIMVHHCNDHDSEGIAFNIITCS